MRSQILSYSHLRGSVLIDSSGYGEQYYLEEIFFSECISKIILVRAFSLPRDNCDWWPITAHNCQLIGRQSQLSRVSEKASKSIIFDIFVIVISKIILAGLVEL
jgi:hypothetical protein